MPRRALVPGTGGAGPRAVARRGARGVRRAADQRLERPVGGPGLGARRQAREVDRAQRRTALTIDDGDDDLRAAGGVEDDPVDRRAARGDADEISCAELIHPCSVVLRRQAPDASTIAPSISPVEPSPRMPEPRTDSP